MKKSLMLLFTVLMGLVMVLGACSSSSGAEESASGDTKEKSNSSSGTLDIVKEKGVIEVGSTPSGPPFTFLNTETGKIDGLMVDIANRVAKDIGVKANIQSVQWPSLIPSIEGGKINMIAAGMSRTEERDKVIDFSEPVYSYGEAIVVRSDDDEIKSFEDLKGKKIGVQEASIYYTGVKEYPEIETQTYTTHQDMAAELKNGRIDAFFADYPIFVNMLKELPNLKGELKILTDHEPKWIAEISIGMPNNSKEFQEEINKSIEKMKESGELNEILKKWELE
jgi:polar amino acid transport system substrate-binding protein